MVDYFSLAVTHGLLALAAWRLMLRADLDRDPAPGDAKDPPVQPPRGGKGRPRA